MQQIPSRKVKLDTTSAWLQLVGNHAIQPKHWLQALSSLKVGVCELMSNKNIHSQLPSKLQTALTQDQSKLVERCLVWQHASALHHIITIDDTNYPERLKQLDSPPLVLFCIGELTCLQRKAVAIVGARQASVSGLREAFYFATELSKQGICIISGLALGADGAAHKGATVAEQGTIAVLGCGPDVIYPRKHAQLYDQIIQHKGLIVSEFVPGTKPRPEYFPRRNRVIVALSHAVLVAEARIKSGSMITAQLAADMGIDVLAVPGNINNELKSGCHLLIQQGAKLATTIQDVLAEIGSQQQMDLPLVLGATNSNGEKFNTSRLATDKILDTVDYDVTSIDAIVAQSGQSIAQVLANLAELELRGLVTTTHGGYVKL